MAATVFFNNKGDLRMAQDFVAQDNDMYIAKMHYRGRGVYANSTSGVSTLTPATSPAWTVDDFNSTTMRNLVVLDDNEKAARAKVADTAATEVTFDETDCLLDEDETTAASFTVGETYDFYILTPGNTVDGFFLGQTKLAELNITDEPNTFAVRKPGGLAHKDAGVRNIELLVPYLQRSNEDFVQLFGLQQYGSQTSQFSYGIGTDEPAEPTPNLYMVTFVGKDKQDRQMKEVLWNVKFDMGGNFFNVGDGGNLEHPLHGDVLADQFYPRKAFFGKIVRAD